MSRCQRECQEFESPILLHIMYKIYYTDPKSKAAFSIDTQHLENALKYCSNLRKDNMQFVTMVTDYENMVGKPGAQGAGAEYVPQLKN